MKSSNICIVSDGFDGNLLEFRRFDFCSGTDLYLRSVFFPNPDLHSLPVPFENNAMWLQKNSGDNSTPRKSSKKIGNAEVRGAKLRPRARVRRAPRRHRVPPAPEACGRQRQARAARRGVRR